MSEKINVLLTIEYNDDWIQDRIEMNYNDALLMLQSNENYFPDYFETHEEQYKTYMVNKSSFYYSEDKKNKELSIEFVYAKK